MNILNNINHKKIAKNKKCKAPQYKPYAEDNMRLHFTDNKIAYTYIFILFRSD